MPGGSDSTYDSLNIGMASVTQVTNGLYSFCVNFFLWKLILAKVGHSVYSETRSLIETNHLIVVFVISRMSMQTMNCKSALQKYSSLAFM